MTDQGATIGRILVVDDNGAIHEDFRKILCPDRKSDSSLNELESSLFGESSGSSDEQFSVDFAFQGEQALELVKTALAEHRPYGLAFVDMRMPPGWDGLRTMMEIKKVDPQVQFIICSAYSDYSTDEICRKLEIHDGIIYMAKPFSPDDAKNFARAMSRRIACMA